MIIGTEFITLLTVSLLSASPTKPDQYGGTYTSNKCDVGTSAASLLRQMEDTMLSPAETEAAVIQHLNDQMETWQREHNVQAVEDDISRVRQLMDDSYTQDFAVNTARIDNSGAPYYDTATPREDGYTDVLFKAGVAVQVKELNETQTIIKERTRDLADGIFLETGEMLKAGQITYSNNISYVSLNTSTLLNDYTTEYNGLDASLYIIGKYITDSTGTIKAKVVSASKDSNQATEAINHSLTLYLIYIYSDGSDSTVDNIFKSADNLYILEVDGTVNSSKQIGTVGRYRDFPLEATGKSSIAQIKEGVIYVNGVTVKVWPQTMVIDKWSTVPTYRIGLVMEEKLITAAEDPKLRDNAGGTPNEGAVGADRKQIVVRLAKRAIESRSNERFLDLLKIVNGDVQWKNRYVQEDATKTDIVENEYNHRGDKVIVPFDYEVREHLSTNTDSNGESGLYTSSTGGSDSFISLGVTGGSGTVQGKEVSIQGKQRINIEKSRTVKTKTSTTSVAAQIGNYVVTDGGVDITEISVNATSEYVTWLYFSPNDITHDAFTKINLRKASTVIGTARVRDINRFNSEFKIYLFDIDITTAGNTLKDVEEITTVTNNYKIADINTEFTQTVTQSSGSSETAAFADDTQFGIDTTLSSLNDTSKNKNLFKIPKDGVYHDTGVSSVVINSVKTTFAVTANATPALVVTGLGSYETFDDTNLSSTRNSDVIVYGNSNDTIGKMWTSDELAISYNSGKTEMTITEDGTSSFFQNSNYIVVTPVKLSQAAAIPLTVKFITENYTSVSSYGSLNPLPLTYPNVLDKNWKIYERGNGWGSNADTSDTDISSRYELDTGQRDNTYDTASFKLKDGEEFPTGSLRVDYYYLDAYNATNKRTGDYISVDSYPVGSVPAGTASGWGTFLYTDIPKYTSSSTGITYRLSDVIDFRPFKTSAGVPTNVARTPFNTTVDIGQLKYYQPRIDKVYLTNGSVDPEEISDGSLVIGEKYKIVSIGNSNFTLSGASDNNPDVIFIANSVGTAGYTGKVTRLVGNLRVIKGTPYDGDSVVPDDPKVGLPIFEIRVPSYTFETKDIIVKHVDNVERKNIDVAKYEKIIENLQRHASVDPLEAKADSHDLGSGRKKVGHFFDSFEGQEKSDVLLKEYSASIDRFRNELRPEFSAEVLSVRKTPFCAESLYDPQTNNISDKELLTLPLNAAKNYEIEVQNIEASSDVPLRTTHTDVYNGYMRVTPNYDYWKSVKSRPDLVRNKNGEFDGIKYHPTAADVNGMVWEDWRTHWAGFSKNEFEELSTDTSYKSALNELKKSYEVESNSIEIAGKHVLTDYVPYIRTQNIVIEAYGLRPNTGNIRLKFDGVDITSDVYSNSLTSSSFKNTNITSLKTDDYGRFVGTYTIPNVDAGVGTRKFKTGKKMVVLDSASNDVDCYAESIFNVVGYVDNKVSTRNLEYSWKDQTDDTLSQGLEIFDDCFVKKIDLYFSNKESYGAIRPVILQIRKMIGGKPSDEILPFSTVVVNPTDKLNFTATPSNFAVGDTLRGKTSNGVGIILSISSSQVTINPITGKFDNGEDVTNGTNDYTLNSSSAVTIGIPVDGTTETTFEFSECVYLPKGKYCITLITPSPLYNVKALDLHSESGSRMTGIGQLYQGYDILKGRLLKFKLWRANFDTSLVVGDRTGTLQTSALGNISLEANSLSTWDYTDTTNRNTIKVYQKNHGQVANDKITFGGVVGVNTVFVEFASASSTTGWEPGEVIYQHSADVTGATSRNYPHGILVDFTAGVGGNPNTANIAMLSTDSFATGTTIRQVANYLVSGSAARNGTISSTNFNTFNKYKRRLNGIDVAHINDGAVTSLGSASGTADNNASVNGTGYTEGESIDITTTAVSGTGTGLTVRFVAGSDGIIDNYDSGTKTAGVHVVKPGTGYTVGDQVAISTGNGDARIYITAINANEYTVQSTNLSYDHYEVKRTGTGNIDSGDTSPNIVSFADNTTNGIRGRDESSVVIRSDTAAKGPRRRADLVYNSDTSIIPEDTTLAWSTSFDDRSTYEDFTRNANELLQSTKYIDDNLFLKAIFDSSNSRVSPVVDKSMLNMVLVNNRMDSTEELSTYISRKTVVGDSANSIKVITDAIVPKSSSIEMWCRVDDTASANNFNDISWTQVPQTTSLATDDSDTPVELSFIKDDLDIFSVFQIKVVFKSSDTTKVPRLKNIMAIANYKDDLLKPMQALTLNVVRTAVSSTEDHTIPTEFTVTQGNVFLIDYDSNSSYSSNGNVQFLRDADGSITSLNSTLNTGCTIRFTSTSGTNSFRAVVIIFGR